MQFIVQKENLLNALNAVSKATVHKGIQPILANILIETIDSKTLKLVATDLDISIESVIPASVVKEGKITLQAKKLLEIVSNLSDETINFNIDTEKLMAKINSAQAKFDLMALAPDEFPEIKKISEKDEVEIDLKVFLKAVKQTVFAAASFETNNVLSGVFLSLRETRLEMAATDGNRLARKVAEIKKPVTKECSAIIPTRILNELLRIASTCSDSSIFIGIADSQISFKLSDKYMLSRLLEGRYPDYPKLIPHSYESVAIANRDDIVASIRRTAVMANERTNIIKLDFEKHKLNLSANTPDIGDASDSLEVDYRETGLKIAFNFKFLLEGLQNLESHDVKLEFGGSLAPALIKPDDEEGYLYLIMPVQVK